MDVRARGRMRECRGGNQGGHDASVPLWISNASRKIRTTGEEHVCHLAKFELCVAVHDTECRAGRHLGARPPRWHWSVMLSMASTRGAPAATCSGRHLGAKHASGLNVPTSSFRSTKSRGRIVVLAGKANKPNKASGGSTPKRQAVPGNPQPNAPRITGKVGNMSVHTQIKLVERYKSLSKGNNSKSNSNSNSSGNGSNSTIEKPTTYRKTKDDAYHEELARRRAAKQAEARHLQHLKSFKGVGSPPTLLVDGYNVCASDEGEEIGGLGMREAFLAGDLEVAQRLLISQLDMLAAHKGYRIICCFDADRTGGSQNPSSNGLDQASKTKTGVWVVFSVTNDADSWIEKASLRELQGKSSVDGILKKLRTANGGKVVSENERVSNRDDEMIGDKNSGDDKKRADSKNNADSKTTQRTVYVATSDNALSSVCTGNGAYAVSSGSLIEELVAAQRSETEILRELSVKARWGGEKRGNAMVTKDQTTADKLMELYKQAPNTSAVEQYGSKTGGFSGRPKKGKKNKKGK